MRWFRSHRNSVNWHKDVQATSNDEMAVILRGGTLNEAFPWAQLQRLTDAYIKSKEGKEFFTQAAQDARLTALVHGHPSKTIALAACAHRLSPEAVRHLLLADLHTTPHDGISASSLHAVLIARVANPLAVSDAESAWAHLLLPLAEQETNLTSGPFMLLLTTLTVPSNMLFARLLDELAYRACFQLGATLERYKMQNDWLRAHTSAEFLRAIHERLCDYTPESRTCTILDKVLPTWRIWAAWRPNLHRLHGWEALSTMQRVDLRDLLSLEGPDHRGKVGATDVRESSLGEAVAKSATSTNPQIQNRGLKINLHERSYETARRMLDSMLRSLDNACKLGYDAVELLIVLFIKGEISQRVLGIAEDVLAKNHPTLTRVVRDFFQQRDHSGSCYELEPLLLCLSCEDQSRLRVALLPYLTAGVLRCFGDRKTEYQNELEKGTAPAVRGAMLRVASLSATGLALLISHEDQLHHLGHLLQSTKWLQTGFGKDLKNFLNTWPSRREVVVLQDLRRVTMEKNMFNLSGQIQLFCLHRLVKPAYMDPQTKRTVSVLVAFWQATDDEDRRELGLRILETQEGVDLVHMHMNLTCLCRCSKDFVFRLNAILLAYNSNSAVERTKACVDMAHILALQSSNSEASQYDYILQRMIERADRFLFEVTMTTMKPVQWLRWIGDLATIFGARLHVPRAASRSSPSVLDPRLHSWVQGLHCHIAVFQQLEINFVSDPALQCLLSGHSDSEQVLKDILDLLEYHAGRQCMPLMLSVVAFLTKSGDNANEIFAALSSVSDASFTGVEACNRLLDFHQRITRSVTESFLAGWLDSAGLRREDKKAVKVTAALLGYIPEEHERMPAAFDTNPTRLDAVSHYLEDQLSELLAEARRLEGIRLALKAVNHDGTRALLASIGISDTSLAEDALALMPAKLVDFVEAVGEREIEMYFPFGDLKPFQKAAMGADNAQSLLVRLVLGDADLPAAFCMHLHEGKPAVEGHSHWIMLDDAFPPNVHFCYGEPSRVTYQLSRELFRHLQQADSSLEAIYTLIADTLKNLGCKCIVCGVAQGTKLHRTALCDVQQCLKTYREADLQVQLGCFRQEPMVLDLLLTSACAAASSNHNTHLLANCPIAYSNVVQTIECMPSVSQGSSFDTLFSGTRTQKDLFTWLAASYRGYLIAATSGQCKSCTHRVLLVELSRLTWMTVKIPSMPNIHQFLLASAHPAITRSFNAHVTPSSTPSILFHGTSLDRLHAILTSGLKVCSGTNLQRWGAVLGNGIYMAEEPSKAVGYCSGLPAAAAGGGWKNSQFTSVRILLACEYAGSQGGNTDGVYVITDPTALIVRYVFLLQQGALAPFARHIVPAIKGVCATLRAG